jgi:diacylglycerol kinase (ATP)
LGKIYFLRNRQCRTLKKLLRSKQVLMAASKDTLLGHIINAFVYSFAGLKAAWKNELAFRGETAVFAVMIPLGIWLGRTAVEQALLVGSCLIVLITELLNSAVEAVVDRIGTERHELSKRAKDLGSAAALLSMIAAAVVWVVIAYERFLS